MNETIKYAIWAIILTDILILIFVGKVCESISYVQLPYIFFMQSFSIFLFIESKWRDIVVKMTNSCSAATLKIAAVVGILVSFYLLVVAKKGIYVQGGISTCGQYGERFIGSFF